MNSSRIAPLWVIFSVFIALVGCEFGPFQSQTRQLPGAVTVDVNDPLFLSGDPEANQWYLETISAPDAWRRYAAIAADPVGGGVVRTVPVAVIDSGIHGGHEDLRGVLGRTGIDLVGGTVTLIPQGFPADAEGIQHGTHVSGLIAAEGGNGRGVAGVSYNGWGRPAASVVPIRSLEGLNGLLSDVIRGVLYAAGAAPGQEAAPARVINMSLGADVSALDQTSILLFESAVEEAARRGLLMVAASGNGRVPGNGSSDDGPQGRSDGIDWPARFPHVIAVGSVDRAAQPEDSQRSYFSDYGLQLELVAPGAESSGPNAEDNTGIVSTVPAVTPSSGYGLLAGTSMAAPLVAGAAATVWSANPHLSAEQVRRILQDTAIDLGDPGRDEEYGYGLLNLDAALQAAATTPYGRYESPSASRSSVPAHGSVTARELQRTTQNTEYRPDLPAEFLVYLSDTADIGEFTRRVHQIAPLARVASLGRLPLGDAMTVSMAPASVSEDSSGFLFAALTNDAQVLSVAQNRLLRLR
ncbi:MAG TPA: S8 family serine peptidase [Alkalispirochaeta sp.]|nr:S8 family serine peptidase [Alkalispirochaeta sp.]